MTTRHREYGSRTARSGRRDRGSALLTVLVLGAAIGATASLMSLTVRRAVEDQRARADVLCARLAARSGLLIGPLAGDGAALFPGGVSSLEVRTVLRHDGWCVVRSRAVCGSATRHLEETVDPSACG
jgi:hypothetical protein